MFVDSHLEKKCFSSQPVSLKKVEAINEIVSNGNKVCSVSSYALAKQRVSFVLRTFAKQELWHYKT